MAEFPIDNEEDAGSEVQVSLGEKLREVPSGESGVYCMYDLDLNPAYVGQSSDLRSRLRQHFIRQDSSVVSYGRLDIWDISQFDFWQTTHADDAEQFLIHETNPYLNFGEGTRIDQSAIDIDIETPDGTIQLISEGERKLRSKPYNRVKQKLDHLSRMVDKIQFAGHSDKTKRTLYQHQAILEENLSQFLGIDVKEGREGDLRQFLDTND